MTIYEKKVELEIKMITVTTNRVKPECDGLTVFFRCFLKR